MTTGIVVCSILFPADQKFGVEELSVLTGANFVDRGGVEVDKDGTRDVFIVARLVEEGLIGAWITNGGIRVRAAISLQAMLE